MKKQQIAILCGGTSSEHEVSVITGLQVLENIDRSKYGVHFVYQTKKGVFRHFAGAKTRVDFAAGGGQAVAWGRDVQGAFFVPSGLLAQKVYVDCVYMAYHGGLGEGGQMAGFFESLQLPITSSGAESSVITMNKALCKAVLREHQINVVDGVSFTSSQVETALPNIIKMVLNTVGLPAIVKPVHMGSSIGIKVVRTEVELKMALLEARYIDTEILVEKYIQKFTEYNISVFECEGELQLSEIERPKSSDEILSFADKYQRGAKKQGSGMASLQRELPAKIGDDLKKQILGAASRAYSACRCSGRVRIDFMQDTQTGELYLTEINPIPGSVAYYLWEAMGVTFAQQITASITQAITNFHNAPKPLDYKTDIVEKFIKS